MEFLIKHPRMELAKLLSMVVVAIPTILDLKEHPGKEVRTGPTTIICKEATRMSEVEATNEGTTTSPTSTRISATTNRFK